METFKDEIKNLKAITRVIAALVLANFVIIALVIGPDSVGFDPTYGPITAILNFVIAFLGVSRHGGLKNSEKTFLEIFWS